MCNLENSARIRGSRVLTEADMCGIAGMLMLVLVLMLMLVLMLVLVLVLMLVLMLHELMEI
jgi:hypothetical protein